MERVRRAVAELNAMADSGAGEVVKRRDGSHGFATPSIGLTFWENGLQVDTGNLRPYGSPDATAFLRDLLDGYFPYELKHAFPEGVVFVLSDHTERTHGMPAPYEWGSGRKLDSRGDSRVVAEPGLLSAAQNNAPLLSGRLLAGFVSAAPSGSAGALVCGGAAESVTYAAGDMSMGGSGSDGAAGDKCRLQIKGASGQLACVLELPETATLANVHNALLTQSVVGVGLKYELRTAFPARTLVEMKKSLRELGLAPSATLCVRLVTE